MALGLSLRRHADQVFPSGRKLTFVQDSHTKTMKWRVITIERFAGSSNNPKSPSSDGFAGSAGSRFISTREMKNNINYVYTLKTLPALPANEAFDSENGRTALPANGALDSENGILATCSHPPGVGEPTKRAEEQVRAREQHFQDVAETHTSFKRPDDPGLNKFKAGIAKRKCCLCSRSFPYDLTPYYAKGVSGYICCSCHMDGTPPTKKTNPQTNLGDGNARSARAHIGIRREQG